MSAVAAPMAMRVMMRTTRRPSLSPKWPARNAPEGRKGKLIPTVAKATVVDSVDQSGPKKSWLKISPDAAAERK